MQIFFNSCLGVDQYVSEYEYYRYQNEQITKPGIWWRITLCHHGTLGKAKAVDYRIKELEIKLII